MTQEIIPVQIGSLSRKKMRFATLYEVPDGFQEAVEFVLSDCDEKTTLSEIFPAGTFTSGGTKYNLGDRIFISTSYSMSWIVKDANAQTGRCSLIAIGQNREARKKDWIGYLRLYSEDHMPTLNEYLTVREVDGCFFEKKAVYKFSETGMERIK